MPIRSRPHARSGCGQGLVGPFWSYSFSWRPWALAIAFVIEPTGEYGIVLDSNVRLKPSLRLRKRLRKRLGGE